MNVGEPHPSMKTVSLVKWAATGGCLALLASVACAAEDSLVTAVYSKTHNGYERTQSSDGALARQTYAVAKGTYEPGLRGDPSIERVKFAGVVRALAPYLARQNYVPAPDRESADLLLVLHWGTTKPFDRGTGMYADAFDQATDVMSNLTNLGRRGAVDRMFPQTGGDNANGTPRSAGQVAEQAQAESELGDALIRLEMANRVRERANLHNANLLGYVHEINRRNNGTRFAGGGTAFNELIEDIESERYYVVIGAYDMQAVLKGERRLVWETRVSIRTQGNRFDEWLPAMFATATNYFGEESGRLVRRFQRATKVELGELKSLGIVDDAAMQEN